MQPSLLPSIPSAQELYDGLMAPIEPELTSVERPKLKAKYHYESPNQQETRKRRYAVALRKYYAALKSFVDEATQCFKVQGRQSLRATEAKDRDNETRDLEHYFISSTL